VRQEIFFLAYHLHWSPSEALDLAVDERWHYLRLLVDQLEHEHAAVEKAGRR
jgi:hypothetical protein